jgi:sugar lactone lactonase YvrE
VSEDVNLPKEKSMTRRAIHLASMTLMPTVLVFGCTGGDTSGDSAGEMAEEAPAPAVAPVTVASGLNGPMGVGVAPDGTVWVVDSGTAGDDELTFPDIETHEITPHEFGHTARVIRIAPDGTQTDVGTLPSLHFGEDMLGASRVVVMDGVAYVTSGEWAGGMEEDRLPFMAAVVRIEGGEMTELASTWPIERDENPAGALVETHPYGLAEGPDGMLWLADAAGNTLFRVDPASGDVELVAVFDALPSPIPNPARGNALETEPVPTGVAFDADGNIYVSFLPGAPFLPGSAKVVRVTEDGSVSDYATDLSMLTDLQTGPDGNLYAVSMGEFTEQGPTPSSGSIVRIRQGTASEAVLTGLSFPTGLAFAANGDAYVTINGVGAPGGGQVVRYAGLAGGM